MKSRNDVIYHPFDSNCIREIQLAFSTGTIPLPLWSWVDNSLFQQPSYVTDSRTLSKLAFEGEYVQFDSEKQYLKERVIHPASVVGNFMIIATQFNIPFSIIKKNKRQFYANNVDQIDKTDGRTNLNQLGFSDVQNQSLAPSAAQIPSIPQMLINQQETLYFGFLAAVDLSKANSNFRNISINIIQQQLKVMSGIIQQNLLEENVERLRGLIGGYVEAILDSEKYCLQESQLSYQFRQKVDTNPVFYRYTAAMFPENQSLEFSHIIDTEEKFVENSAHLSQNASFNLNDKSIFSSVQCKSDELGDLKEIEEINTLFQLNCDQLFSLCSPNRNCKFTQKFLSVPRTQISQDEKVLERRRLAEQTTNDQSMVECAELQSIVENKGLKIVIVDEQSDISVAEFEVMNSNIVPTSPLSQFMKFKPTLKFNSSYQDIQMKTPMGDFSIPVSLWNGLAPSNIQTLKQMSLKCFYQKKIVIEDENYLRYEKQCFSELSIDTAIKNLIDPSVIQQVIQAFILSNYRAVLIGPGPIVNLLGRSLQLLIPPACRQSIIFASVSSDFYTTCDKCTNQANIPEVVFSGAKKVAFSSKVGSKKGSQQSSVRGSVISQMQPPSIRTSVDPGNCVSGSLSSMNQQFKTYDDFLFVPTHQCLNCFRYCHNIGLIPGIKIQCISGVDNQYHLLELLKLQDTSPLIVNLCNEPKKVVQCHALSLNWVQVAKNVLKASMLNKLSEIVFIVQNYETTISYLGLQLKSQEFEAVANKCTIYQENSQNFINVMNLLLIQKQYTCYLLDNIFSATLLPFFGIFLNFRPEKSKQIGQNDQNQLSQHFLDIQGDKFKSFGKLMIHLMENEALEIFDLHYFEALLRLGIAAFTQKNQLISGGFVTNQQLFGAMADQHKIFLAQSSSQMLSADVGQTMNFQPSQLSQVQLMRLKEAFFALKKGVFEFMDKKLAASEVLLLKFMTTEFVPSIGQLLQ